MRPPLILVLNFTRRALLSHLALVQSRMEALGLSSPLHQYSCRISLFRMSKQMHRHGLGNVANISRGEQRMPHQQPHNHNHDPPQNMIPSLLYRQAGGPWASRRA